MNQLSEIDCKILKLLQNDGRMGNTTISRELGLTHTMVARRLEAMEKSGLISGYQAIVNPAAIGLGETIFVMVQLKSHGDGVTEKFENDIRDDFPNVIETAKLSGTWDYILRIAAHSMKHCDEIHTKIGKMPEVKLLRSFPTFSVTTRPIPLPEPHIKTDQLQEPMK